MVGNYSFIVRAHCATYNHSAYITDTMNGFVMQQTDFPFVCTIMDDASTDGEQDVIRGFVEDNFDLQDASVAFQKDVDYGHVIFARHKININCYFAIIFLNENHYSQKKSKAPYLKEWMDAKYVALCEGDDYWTDPLKLQKQVDFLEGHPDFTMCFHGADIKNESSRKVLLGCESIQTREYFPSDVFPDWVVPTASMVYKKQEVDGYPIKHQEWFCPGDIVLIMKCMHTGRVWAMKEHMSVYRMNNWSVSSIAETIESRNRMCKHYEALMLNFPKVDREFCNRYISAFHYSRFRKDPSAFNKVKHLCTAIRFSPNYVLRKLFAAL